MSLLGLFTLFAGEPADNIGFSSAQFSAFDFQILPTDSLSGFELDTDGTIDKLDTDGPTLNVGTWATGTFTATDYDVMLEDNLGGVAVGSGSLAYDTWYQMSGTRAWWSAVPGTGDRRVKGTWRIRPTGGGADIDTAVFQATASVEP